MNYELQCDECNYFFDGVFAIYHDDKVFCNESCRTNWLRKNVKQNLY